MHTRTHAHMHTRTYSPLPPRHDVLTVGGSRSAVRGARKSDGSGDASLTEGANGGGEGGKGGRMHV